MFFVLLRGGACLPIKFGMDKFRTAIDLFLVLLNDLENPIHKYFLCETADHLPACILMKEVIGYYALPYAVSAHEKIADVLEKQLGDGEQWKKDE